MAKIRLQKWLSGLGVVSRREAERLLVQGKIRLNGQVVTELGTRLDPEVDRCEVDGRPVAAAAPERLYYMLCKPPGVLTTRKDPEGRPTIYDLPSVQGLPHRVVPVGRLDFNTEGLLLLSNDGELVHRLMHPKWQLARQYYAYVEDRLSPVREAKIRKGLHLEDGPTGPVEIDFVKATRSKGAWYRVQVREGRNRLVRRLFEASGTQVRRLIRSGFGAVTLPEDLAPGELRPLLREERLALFAATELMGQRP